MSARLIVLCNALDDGTRLERGIVTDSPAASRKVLLLCRALRRSGVRATVLSLGRGRPDGSGRSFRASVRRVDGVVVVYLPFVHRRVVSEIVSLVAPVGALLRFHRYGGRKTILFYNRMTAYLPALFAACLLRFRTVLDLEDGEVTPGTGPVRRAGSAILQRTFDRLCSGGALLACNALGDMTSLRPAECYYGTVERVAARTSWAGPHVVALLGGTVSHDTGAGLLVNAIRTLREENPVWCRCLRFEITGKGDAMSLLRELEAEDGLPSVRVHGRLTDADYQALVKESHVGLALKPAVGPLANTTFPSKIVELASSGLLVLTTDISDVRRVLGEGGLYLEDQTAASLIERLRWIVDHRQEAVELAREGMIAVWRQCTPAVASRKLTRFLFEARA